MVIAKEGRQSEKARETREGFAETVERRNPGLRVFERVERGEAPSVSELAECLMPDRR